MIAVLASDARVLAVTDLVRADGPTALSTWLDEPPLFPIPALRLTVGATTTKIQTTMAGYNDVEFKVQPHVPEIVKRLDGRTVMSTVLSEYTLSWGRPLMGKEGRRGRRE